MIILVMTVVMIVLAYFMVLLVIAKMVMPHW